VVALITIIPALSKNLSATELRAACQQRVNALVKPEQLDPAGLSRLQLGQQVTRIVKRNLASGRAQRVMSHDRQREPLTRSQLEQYIDRVIGVYLIEHARIERLAAQADAEWNQLQAELTTRARRMLQHWPASVFQPQAEAPDFAQQACETIFNAIFPYDVAFDAWATVILNNHIRQRATRSRDLVDRNPSVVSLDQPTGSQPEQMTALYDLVQDPTADHLFETVELQLQITAAIARLSSPTQQLIILYSFLYGWSDKQLANHLAKTEQAIYNLRHRALRQLRHIFEEMGSQDMDANLH
jgi:RNA polymerase sigma factor (sigma-70 family)